MNSKPQWKDAPIWAEWLAQDADYTWFWFESEPFADDGAWHPEGGKARFAAVERKEDYEETLEARPK